MAAVIMEAEVVQVEFVKVQLLCQPPDLLIYILDREATLEADTAVPIMSEMMVMTAMFNFHPGQ